jgi:hypothetical protein
MSQSAHGFSTAAVGSVVPQLLVYVCPSYVFKDPAKRRPLGLAVGRVERRLVAFRDSSRLRSELVLEARHNSAIGKPELHKEALQEISLVLASAWIVTHGSRF